jgi:hypothetical protein
VLGLDRGVLELWVGVLQHRSCTVAAAVAGAATAVVAPPAAQAGPQRPMQLPRTAPQTHQNLLLARTASFAHTFMR